MGMNISNVAKELDMTAYTIRYYDKLGLLAQVKRVEGGKRCFTQEDIDRLSVIRCLKNTGMSINDIKSFMSIYSVGEDNIELKRKMILHQKQVLEEKIEQLKGYIHQSEFKLWFFDNIVKDGVEPPYSKESFRQWQEGFEKFLKNNEKNS